MSSLIWEHKVVEFRVGHDDAASMEEALNELSSLGWEVAATLGSAVILKRPIPGEEEYEEGNEDYDDEEYDDEEYDEDGTIRIDPTGGRR
jgi:hypothetical protein